MTFRRSLLVVGIGRICRAVLRAGAWLLAIGLAGLLVGVPRAFAADPSEVVLSGAPLPQPIVITDLSQTAYVRVDLCSAQEAGPPAGRQFLDIRVTWTDELSWVGRFYPAVGALPAAVDIPSWKLYGSGFAVSTCRDRVVGPAALAMLRRYEVPVVLPALPATDMSLLPDRRLHWLGWVLLTLSAVHSVVLSIGRKGITRL